MALKKATYLNNKSNLKKSGRLLHKAIALTCMATLKPKKPIHSHSETHEEPGIRLT